MPKNQKSTDGALLSPSASQDVPGPMPATERAAAAVPPGQKPPVRTEAPDQHHDEPRHPGIPLAPPGIVPESDVRVHSPSSAAPQPSHGHVNEGLRELPWGYGDGRLVALVRDPVTLFVYWDFSPQQIAQGFAGRGASRPVLKVLDARAELVRATEVRLDARGWYLR